jgi:hypothetical protein
MVVVKICNVLQGLRSLLHRLCQFEAVLKFTSIELTGDVREVILLTFTTITPTPCIVTVYETLAFIISLVFIFVDASHWCR